MEYTLDATFSGNAILWEFVYKGTRIRTIKLNIYVWTCAAQIQFKVFWWWLFSSLARIWGNGFNDSFPVCAFFFFFFWSLSVCFKWWLARAYRFHFFGQDQSTVAQRAKTIVAEGSLTNFVWARFHKCYTIMHNLTENKKQTKNKNKTKTKKENHTYCQRLHSIPFSYTSHFIGHIHRQPNHTITQYDKQNKKSPDSYR